MLKAHRDKLAQDIESLFPEGWTQDFISESLELPKQRKMGHIALPVFRLSKDLRKSPPDLAKDFSSKINALNLSYISKVEPASGFINVFWKEDFLMEALKAFLAPEEVGRSKLGCGKKMIIDYSSPNVAKPMHVGHLRATIIGQALRNLAETQGYEVVGLNHLGDWGVAFGKLAWAYEKWKSDYDFENDAFESMCALYVRFHKEAKENADYESEGAKTFKALEEGDEALLKIWKMFIEISMKEYEKTWARLGVKHDLVRGESFYSDRLQSVVEELQGKKLLVESEGAFVVELDEKRPPCLITKSDGASLYATRDLASALYRMEELNCDLNLYVTGQEQKLHFSQVFSVLDKMGYAWAKDCHHIAFGIYRFKDMGKMSSREGQVIRINDVLDKTVKTVRARIEERSSHIKNKDEVAEKVGLGAVVFNDLMNDRVKDVDFDWEKVTDFEGDSGPYVQYSAVRCKSILRKAQEEEAKPLVPLVHEKEVELINLLLNFERTLTLSFQSFKPNYLASYLLEVSKAFSSFYGNCPILSLEDDTLKASRLFLVKSTLKVLVSGLKVLNIESPDEM